MQKITTKLDKAEKKLLSDNNILKIEPLVKDFVKVTVYNGKREIIEQTQMNKTDFINPINLKEILQDKIVIDLTSTTQKNIDDFIDRYFSENNQIRVQIINDLPTPENIIEFLNEVSEEERQDIINRVYDKK